MSRRYKILYYKNYDDVRYELPPIKTEVIETSRYGLAVSYANDNLDKYGAICANIEIY